MKTKAGSLKVKDLSRAHDRRRSCNFNCICSLHRIEVAATLQSLCVKGEKKILLLEKKKGEKGRCFPGIQKMAQGEIRHQTPAPLPAPAPSQTRHGCPRLSITLPLPRGCCRLCCGSFIQRLQTLVALYNRVLALGFSVASCRLGSRLCGPIAVLPWSSPCFQPETGPGV